MARDKTKRLAVRHLLLQKEWQEKSDREVATEAEVGKVLVGSVRREMMAAGEIPPPVLSSRCGGHIQAKAYRPGTVARGGYVYDENGRTIRDIKYQRQQRRKKVAP